MKKEMLDTTKAGERTQDEYRVIYLVTLNESKDRGGFQYLTSRNTWALDHEEGLAFRSEDSAHKAASELKTEGDVAVLCSARRGSFVFADDADKAKRDARNKTRRDRDQAMRDLGLVKVKGGLGGTYWE